MRYACIALTIALNGMATSGSAMAQAPIIYTQSACTLLPPDDYCALIFTRTNPTGIVREFQFTTAKAGTALVTFNGSMTCQTDQTTGSNSILDLNTQIVTSVGAIASPIGPSSSRLRNGVPLLNLHAINLASSRVIGYRSPGPKTVALAYSSNVTNYGNTCYVYNAAFTVLFFPK
jgi:hypothetical protein